MRYFSKSRTRAERNLHVEFRHEVWTMPRHLGYKRRDAEKLEARRIAAMARLRRGEPTSNVARSLGVCIQSVQRWARNYRLHGELGLRRLPKSGPRPKLPREKLARLADLLAQGPLSFGFSTPVWTSERIAHLIWSRFRVRYSCDHVKRLLPSLGWGWNEHTWMPVIKGRNLRPERALQRSRHPQPKKSSWK
jgi:transposase